MGTKNREADEAVAVPDMPALSPGDGNLERGSSSPPEPQPLLIVGVLVDDWSMNASGDSSAAGERVVRYWIWPVAREWKHQKSWVVARAVVLAFGLGFIFWTWGRPTPGGFEWGVQAAITLVYVWGVWVMFGPLRVKRKV